MAVSVSVGLGCGGNGASPGPDSPKAEIVIPPSVSAGEKGASGDDRTEWTGAPYGESEVTATRVAGGFDVSIRVKRKEGMAVPTAAVPFTAEPFLFTVGSAAGELDEANLFGSGLAMDLDGDGETTTVLPLTCEGAVARVGDVGVPPVGPGGANSYVYYSTSGSPKITRLGDEGAHMVLYNPCDKPPVSIGVSPPGQTMELETSRGPALQILVIEEVSAPGQKPAFSIEEVTLGGARQDVVPLSTYIFDGTNDSPTWHAARWVMLPLDATVAVHEARLRIAVPEADAMKRNVVVGVSASPAPGERRRIPQAQLTLE